MSQDSERRLSQGSLAPPAEIAGPTSPVQRASLSASPVLSLVAAATQASQQEKSKFVSPPPLSSSDMTPPPSSQIPGAPLRRSHSRSSSYLASPPDMEKTLCAAYGASENLPTVEDIESANESRLRSIAKELLSVAQESRMSALHFKLQHSLLSFTSSEAIKRAEVEQHLARREVEILQSSEYRNRVPLPESKPSQPAFNADLEVALKRNQELERANATLDRRLRRAKKLIEDEKEKFELLAEENSLLKKRIRDNREHFSRMFDHGSMSPRSQSDMPTPQRRTNGRFAADGGYVPISRPAEGPHDAFAALLAADKMLNRESASLGSSPNRSRAAPRPQYQSHTRGSHSMTSLPTTPARNRAVCDEHEYLTPMQPSQRRYEYSEIGSQQEQRDRHDRDSTISASDAEEAVTDQDVPASQASSLATSMLRRSNPASSSQVESHLAPPHQPPAVPKSSTLLQTKLFGHVTKAGYEPPPSYQKRKASFDEDSIAAKKSRSLTTADGVGVGLGIESWTRTGRS